MLRMILTVAKLVAAGIEPTQARRFVDPLKAACALFDISTPASAARTTTVFCECCLTASSVTSSARATGCATWGT